MQRFILSGLTTLALATTVVSSVNAQTPTAVNPYVANTTEVKQLTPAQVAALATQGYFQAQGIPANTTLTQAYRLGTISAKDVVEGAVRANRLPAEVADDTSYIMAVDNQLQVVHLNF
jgi:hypothetical protein